MAELSRFWNGTTIGDATEAPYDAPTEFAEVMVTVSGAGSSSNRGGVSFGELGNLAVAAGAGAVSVASGVAIVDGNWYKNTAALSVSIPTPAGATRIDYIVLRKDWAGQTVRITRIAGTEGGAAPTLTQTQGTTWDIPLAEVSITTGGVITVTDRREQANIIGSTVAAIQFDGASLAGGASGLAAAVEHVHATPKVRRVIKTADQTVTGGTSLQNDTDLKFAMVANEQYIVQIVLFVDGDGGGDIKIGFTVPAGATYRIAAIGPNEATITTVHLSPTVDPSFLTAQFGIDAVPNDKPIVMQGAVICAATPGDFQVQWAQVNAVGSTKVQVYSHILAVEATGA